MMKLIKLISLSCAVFVAVVFVYIYSQIQQIQKESLNLTTSRLFEVKPGTGLNALCEQWQAEKLTTGCWRLQILAKLDPKLTDIKAGVYQLQPAPLLDNLRRINSGRVHLFSFRIIEGESFSQVLANLNNLPYIKKVTLSNMDGFFVNALNIKQNKVEGWLFPDTYFYQAGDTDLSLLERSHALMKAALNELWQLKDKNLPYSNAYEALIMASIIEKETAKASERPLIASVFINRLHKKMRLQTDPTVIYGLAELFDGDLTRAHLKQYTPYNTYRIKALPPTPIAMPSYAAIKAALSPMSSNYYYFVAKGDGSHQFSENLSQHNSAVRKYQLKLKKGRNDS
ncbi:endolytic transglycosylase MltG [Pseudoalteromonas denitrificans]|uniref:Endolytic murein transglycosylase n=1 Tax=Pseudoalteromonas denitrificans DSM 6059 TaxID=1123010 RepID=A0A1I1Q6E2_9GAMM|nr:endolytic transglycosylase MltG [Pseudoalteromonas denitrificans]SFD17587.1 UPF0755 protein [Pseudoalteromonas denitrificans DSM 6059]